MAAPEKSAVKVCHKPLIDGLAEEDIDSIADDLLSNSLISNDVYEGLLPSKTKKQKARDVVNNVTGKVNANPKDTFAIFIKVLNDNEQSRLAQLLEDKFGE